MNTDTDHKFTVATDHPMLFIEGSFNDYRNFYFAVMSGFGIPIEQQLCIFNDIKILLKDYWLKHQN